MRFPIDSHFWSTTNRDVDVSSCGIDIGVPCGTPVVACDAGTVVFAAPISSSPQAEGMEDANQIVIKLARPVLIDAKEYEFASYAGLRSLAVEAGDHEGAPVALGQMLGRSGRLFGVPHVNFSLFSSDNKTIGDAVAKDRLARFVWEGLTQADAVHLVKTGT